MARFTGTDEDVVKIFEEAHDWWVKNYDGRFTGDAARMSLKAICAPFTSEIVCGSRETVSWASIRKFLNGERESPYCDAVDLKVLGGPLTNPQGADEDGAAIFDALSEVGEAHVDRVLASREAEVTLPENGPVGLLVQGDPHIGSVGCCYSLLKKHLALSKREDLPVYNCCIGDVLDGKFGLSSKFATVVAQQSGTPWQHVLAAAHWITESATPKEHGLQSTLGLVPGNHDLWSHRNTGVGALDTALAICREKINYSPTELRLTINHGDVTHIFVLRHKVRGTSMYSPAHGVQRWLRHNPIEDADAVFAGHTHEAGVVGPLYLYGKPRYGIQVASYVDGVADEYAVTQGYPVGQHHYPGCLIIMSPDRRELQTFLDVDFGVWVLEQQWRELKRDRRKKR